MNSYTRILLLVSLVANITAYTQKNISLAGPWQFAADPNDKGVNEKWFNQKLKESVMLPGSMTTNGKGDDINVNTPWTGQIVDSSWFKSPAYAAYRQHGNIKIPFWLQPVKYYKGAAWYQKTITIPADWKNSDVQLFIERAHWETTLWIDDNKVGMQNSMGAPHIYSLAKWLTPGRHQITIRVDNRIKGLNVGPNSHSITDHTQSNWNGMIGRLELSSQPSQFIDEVQVYPNLRAKEAVVKIKTVNNGVSDSKAQLQISVTGGIEKLKPLSKQVETGKDTNVTTLTYSMGNKPQLWDEFSPNLYQMKVTLATATGKNEKLISFGMREFKTQGTQFTINNNPVFLRGTLECAIFPKTGYPAMEVNEWLRIFKVVKSYGLNHIRFHSWCPPEAAFTAADQLGLYLQVEASSWANSGSGVALGNPIDQWLYDESNRMMNAYGNHPSFVMFTYGNEPAHTKGYKEFLVNFVKYWQQKDSRRLYTTAAGWPLEKESDYNNDIAPRIQGWGAGLTSIINAQPPRTDFDFESMINKWSHPTVSHEVGQWCVYPDFKEIKKYTGVLKAKNFEIFRDRLQQNGMLHLADSFLLASGKLQTLCYKADIEAALRTKGFGGFQLLDLHDFPGQGTALVGVLSPFWEDKGYVMAKEFSRFCNAVVPLARFPKMVYTNNETLQVPVEAAQFSPSGLKNITPRWAIQDESGKILYQGTFKTMDVPVGNGIALGTIDQPLKGIKMPSRLTVSVSLGKYQNTWDIFVYPAKLAAVPADVLVTQQLDEKALQTLKAGGKVLLTPLKGTLKKDAGGDIQIGFSSIFWNTAWTGGQAPHTLGILCNPKHPALKQFPTQYYSNWEWWDAMSHSNAIILDSLAKGIQPIVRVIDDWVTARPLGLLAECKVGNGKLIISGIDFLTYADKRPEARQLLSSILQYMDSPEFNPQVNVSAEKIKTIFK